MPVNMLSVDESIVRLKQLSDAGHGDLVLQTTTPCGQKALVADFQIGPADFGQLVDIVNPS